MDGRDVPIVRLSFTQAPTSPPPGWPCADLSARIGHIALRSLLLWAGTERFERHVRAFNDALSCATSDTSQGCWSAADRILWVALAEALGYGQHREALRQAGRELLTGRASGLRRSSSERAQSSGWTAGALGALARDRAVGAVTRRASGRICGSYRGAACPRRRDLRLARSHHGRERRLPVCGGPGGADGRCVTCRARACGVSGIAGSAIEPDYPRDDAAAWLEIPPDGAAAQQGLHHLWANWCHAKDCERCPCNPRRTSPKTL